MGYDGTAILQPLKDQGWRKLARDRAYFRKASYPFNSFHALAPDKCRSVTLI